MRARKNCVICKNPEAEIFTDAEVDTDGGVITIVMKCPRCTKFKATYAVEPKLLCLSSADRNKLSEYIKREFELTETPVVLTVEILKKALSPI